MPITLSSLQKRRVFQQVEKNLVGLQLDMYQNAQTWKAMATAQNPPVATLRTFMNDGAAAYLTRLQWIIDLRNDANRRQRLLDILATQGINETEIVTYVTELRNAAIALRDAPKGGYAAMTTACDALLASVDAPESLWPE